MKNVSEFKRGNSEVKRIIKELQNGNLEINNVPEEFASKADVVKVERKLGLRKSDYRGFDVIAQKFFVEEKWFHKDASGNLDLIQKNKMNFDSFAEYYEFLDGDVYEDACYYQYTFEDEFSKTLDLDMDRLTVIRSFVTKTIDDYFFEPSQDEVASYNCCEQINKKIVKQWMNKFNTCDTYEQFRKVCNDYKELTTTQYESMEFFFFQYALDAQCNKKHLDVIMEYLSKDYYFGSNIVSSLCLIHTPEDILDKYDFSQASVVTNKKRKKIIKDFVEHLKNQDIEKRVKGYFDKETHFYCEQIKVYCYEKCQGRKILNNFPRVNVCRAFETFDEFIKYRNGDLRNCDLSGDIELDVDFSKFTIDDTTKLPNRKNTMLKYKVQKIYTNGKFYVRQFWYDECDTCVKQFSHEWSYFFDFVAFLKGDLSGADLVFCTGMKNLFNLEGINLKDAKMTSEVCERFNISYPLYDYDKELIGEFSVVEKNEEETALVLRTSRENVSVDGGMFSGNDNQISYISDLHLMHRIQNAKCKSKEDVIYTIQKIIDDILDESTEINFIGGDVSSKFSVFELFVRMLRESKNRKYGRRDFIFVLGNHEFWDFPELSVEQIVEKYRTLLEENEMYLLHNDLYYKNEFDDKGIIPYSELIHLDSLALAEKLRCTRMVILGGLGFSGYNEEFNAKNGIYRKTVDRSTEIRESKKFEQLYNKLLNVLSKRNTIIFTHTPKQDWCADAGYHENFVYVSGHTHRNYFFDDGVERVYADNQIGYRNERPHLKKFLLDGRYDYFEDYEDGIYKITAQEYQDFSRGKNVYMTFNRQINVLYMLKKGGYYCFIHKAKTGSLTILNGGALKKLDLKDVQYYYDNMDAMITYIEAPLNKYTTYQEKIAKEIKKIGGSGRIHGCIIDVDYYNHIYVNPVDLTVTSYWAKDIINKNVYSNIPALLEAKCPKLYSNYLKVIEGKKSSPLMVKKVKKEVVLLPQKYLETDIYKASREIKKMQKLTSNILTTWV